MPGTHAKYSPSKLTRLIHCAGSVLATEGMEDVETSYAAEGTMLHLITEKSIPHGEKVSESLVNQYKLDDGHIEAVNDVLDFVISVKMAHECAFQEYIESKVALTGYIELTGCPGLEHVAGTLDYCLAFPRDRTLYVVDWKYGVMEVLPDSPQLKAYALGALDSIGGRGFQFNSKVYTKVVLVIGQPRTFGGDPFKQVEFTPVELIDWMRATLVPVINDIENRTTLLSPSKAACQWCLVKATCKARREMASETAESVFEIHAKLPHNTEHDEILKLLNQRADLRQYLTDIESYVVARIMNGVAFPGYKMVAGRSRGKWGSEKKMLAYTAALGFSKPDMSVAKIMSPAQATKKVGKVNAVNKLFQALIVKPEGKPTLVPESDRRQALEFGDPESKFAAFAKVKDDV